MNNLKKIGFTAGFMGEASAYPKLFPVRVISQSTDIYKVSNGEDSFFAQVSGKFRFEAMESIDFPAVGDFVMVDRLSNQEGNAIIHHVLSRKSAFVRKAAGTGNTRQIIAANVDKVLICMAMNGDFNLRRLERYLTIAFESEAEPIVVLTKSDLCDDIEEKLSLVEDIARGTEIIVTSAATRLGFDKLELAILPGESASFVGSSGVGKSTLINCILGKDVQATKGLRSDDKGRHTTTSRELFIGENGLIIIDTPGMRELGIDSGDFDKGFSDIENLARICKFSDCQHKLEPDCMVQKAIKDGIIDEARLNSYNKLKKEAGYNGLTSKQLEAQKLNSMFKGVGGIKGQKKMRNEIKNKKR